jgi:squalene-hopene/tetraprenyl-beta-curcumene cyclase
MTLEFDPERLKRAYHTARDALLAERNAEGFWVGELSSSALATAVAIIALKLVDETQHRLQIDAGLAWLTTHQNNDGGWGDTTKSFSNISTSMLVRAAFEIVGHRSETLDRLEAYLDGKCGRTQADRAEAIRNRYGKDRTFSVPILMTCALAGLVPWNEVPRLPFELACLPQSWYRFARLPVVSYALPALIAIGQCVHRHRPTWNPITGPLRWLAKNESLLVLRRIQPSSGGYLEATPLTAFVVMSLATSPTRERGFEREVIESGVKFILESMRSDGSWPIDTNLSIWVTTLSINALTAAGDLESLPDKPKLLEWLLAQQTEERHPFTGAEPGGWGWSHCPGSVPDCDDTPGGVLAVLALAMPLPPLKTKDDWNAHGRSPAISAITNGMKWINDLQNNDLGFPTFCRGWGRLPFDRSGSDLTAHALRAVAITLFQFKGDVPDIEGMRAFELVRSLDYPGPPSNYLKSNQRADGSWLPLWFGNQHAPDDVNPVYGTARVIAAYRDLGMREEPECQRGVSYLLSVQNPDGGWGGAKGCPSSVEETALAVEVLIDLIPLTPDPSPTEGEGDKKAVERGIQWLIDAVESGRFREPSPIGFYFAKLWYFEKLYPLIFTVAALGRALRNEKARRS